MFKNIIAIITLCFVFSSCERSNPDFDINADITYKVNVNQTPIPWLLKTETIQTYVSAGDNVLANETKFNDYSNIDTYFKPFLFYPDNKTLFYSDYKGESETTEWSAVKNNEIVIYSDKVAPEPFEQIVYKITKLTSNQLEMTSRIETFNGNIKTSLRTVLYFERDPSISFQP